MRSKDTDKEDKMSKTDQLMSNLGWHHAIVKSWTEDLNVKILSKLAPKLLSHLKTNSNIYFSSTKKKIPKDCVLRE